MASRSRAQVQVQTGKGREIAGICLLGLGVFCGLSLISLHAGSGTMMGPGGRAMASGLYNFAGVGGYLLVAVLLVVAVRVFRGLAWHRSFSELFGIAGFMGGSTILLHLAFSGLTGAMYGPGGFLGQWLGDLGAGFVGSVGAGLVGSVILVVSLMVLTSFSIAEATGAGLWVARQGVRALFVTSRGVGRLVMSMFPERADRELLEAAQNPFETAAADDDALFEPSELDDTITTPPPVFPEARIHQRTIKGMPATPVLAALPPLESEPVRIGEGASQVIELDRDALGIDLPDEDSLEDSLIDDEPVHPRAAERKSVRRPASALLAEVAAVECAAVIAPSDDPRAANGAAAPVLPIRPSLPPPVIVTPIAPPRQPGAADRVEAKAGLHRRNVIAEGAEPTETPAAQAGPGFIRLSEGDFVLPPSDLLVYVAPPAQEIDKRGLYDMASRLEQAMSNYGVKGNVSAINMGPVVTMYEFAPAPGTRTGKVAQLENDLAMALEAQAVRIVAPIPGKAVVGVEVPNKNRQMVYLKEILAEESIRSSTSKLQIALGKDIKGNPVSVNLSKMPHLLVAGTTGSGKSVTVNGMITSILYNATPEEVRFIMVDPKMLELSIYEGIPHLLLPVVTDPKKANLALRWAVDEMERRYELLAKSGVRDIASYNAKTEIELGRRAGARIAVSSLATPGPDLAPRNGKRLKVVITTPDGDEQEVEVDDASSLPDDTLAISEELREEISAQAAAVQAAEERAETAEKEDPLRKLPYIVIVIDEFADLMMVAPKDVEVSVARLAQKARAAGLHLILATQRPSVDVITGLIKANFPSRIALQVASKIDSRTILDQSGAETLLGNGDMLFSDRGTKLRRIHGAFLSDDEVHRVVDFLKAQAKPVYDMEILRPRDDEGEDGQGIPAEEFHDALYDQAVAIVCETRQASVSFIQRRLQIGYNRSARMVEQMEREGIVGPANGIKPREVLAPGGDYLSSAP